MRLITTVLLGLVVSGCSALWEPFLGDPGAGTPGDLGPGTDAGPGPDPDPGVPPDLADKCTQSSCAIDEACDPATLRCTGELLVPGGTFQIGSTKSGASPTQDDMPRSTRTVAAFYLDLTEVTVGRYRACVQAGMCPTPVVDAQQQCNYRDAAREDHPMNCVSASEAAAYCAFRQKRLPTETEWEFAAVGTLGVAYPFGDTLDPLIQGKQICWSSGQVRTTTCLIGLYTRTLQGNFVASPTIGFADMTGNVWEWTSSQFCKYPATTCATTQFAVRGASWVEKLENIEALRASIRIAGDPGDQFDNRGFRCARTKTP